MIRTAFTYACCFAAALATAQDKTTHNLDFELQTPAGKQPLNWGLGNIQGNTAMNKPTGFLLDSSVKQHGAYSLLIDQSTGSEPWAASSYAINTVFEGKTITLKGYIKTENIDGYSGLWMRIEGKGSQVLEFDNMQKRPIVGTTDWKEYTITLPYEHTAVAKVVVGGLVAGTGKLWMDNLRLLVDDKEIAEAPLYARKMAPAELDTMYNSGSGIATIAINDHNIKSLANLGALWGFIKYYHSEVNQGVHNMDAALFRVLPRVLAAKDDAAVNTILEQWLDSFGAHKACQGCSPSALSEKVKLKADYGRLFEPGNFPPSLIKKLEYIKTNRFKGGTHFYIAKQQGVGNPKFINEFSYEQTEYPDAGVRLLGLFKYWNMIQYFFPDRHLIGEDWNKVLPEFIPAFSQAADTQAYDLACLSLIARVHDTHASIWSGAESLEDMKGDYMTPFKARFIENKLVVTSYYKDTLQIKDRVRIGDVIERINGVPVSELIKKYLPLTSASNYETQLRNMSSMAGWLLRGKTPKIHLQLNRDGKPLAITIDRIKLGRYMYAHDRNESGITGGYKLLDKNIGYIYPEKLNDTDLVHIKRLFANTKGIIIDMRCYPSTFMPFTYGAWLKKDLSPFVQFTELNIDVPGEFYFGDIAENGEQKKDHYKGKLVIIVNEQTQSQAEYTTMALCTAPGAKVIGSITAGADGNVSEIILPGGIRTMISGIGVLYPDGTESQRTGVKIDKVVKPTIAGIKAGRDELMEEAVRLISGN